MSRGVAGSLRPALLMGTKMTKIQCPACTENISWPEPKSLGPLHDWELTSIRSAEHQGNIFHARFHHKRAYGYLLFTCFGSRDFVRGLKELSDGSMPKDPIRIIMDPDDEDKPMGALSNDARVIDIGAFGLLYHDQVNHIVTDTWSAGQGVVVRRIDIPSDQDFILASARRPVYRWNDSKQEGLWYGSEKTRREREEKRVPATQSEMHLRAPSPDAPRALQSGEVHGPCSYDDHPKGCRARAIHAGFGCVVE